MNKETVQTWMKRTVTFFAIIMIIAAVCIVSTPSAQAATVSTTNAAVEWIRAQEGRSIDKDGVPSGQPYQCVDLIKAYYMEYFDLPEPTGSAVDYAYNSVPDGWTKSGDPKPGDVVVWGKGAKMAEHTYADANNGHIGLVIEVNNDSITTLEQNTLNNIPCKVCSRDLGVALCYIHPNFDDIGPDFATDSEFTDRGFNLSELSSKGFKVSGYVQDNTAVARVEIHIRSKYGYETTFPIIMDNQPVTTGYEKYVKLDEIGAGDDRILTIYMIAIDVAGNPQETREVTKSFYPFYTTKAEGTYKVKGENGTSIKTRFAPKARINGQDTFASSISAGEYISVIGEYTNSENNLWYLLDSGHWVYSDNLKETLGSKIITAWNKFMRAIREFSDDKEIFKIGKNLVCETDIVKIQTGVKNYSAGNYIWVGNTPHSNSESYVVSFDGNGGMAEYDSKTVYNGETYDTLPDASMYGYEFEGWYTAETGGTKVEEDTMVNLSGNQTLYAHWKDEIIMSGSCGPEATYIFYGNGLFEIRGTGKITDCPFRDPFIDEDIILRVTEIKIPEGITTLPSYFFAGCKFLKRIDIPKSITKISADAFLGCSGLAEVVIPDSVTEIDERAFYGCSGLTKITVPAGAEYGYDAFNGCNSIKDVTIIGKGEMLYSQHPYRSPWQIGSDAGNAVKVTIEEGVTEIGRLSFTGCSNMVEVIIPKSVKTIGHMAFERCSNLVQVNLPEGISSIGSSAFSFCSGLTEVVIPNSVTEIGASAFSGCSGLTEVMIPNSVTEIGEGAFSGCSGLTEVVIPNSVKVIDVSVFYNCSGLTEIVIPDSVTVIEDSAFSGCSGLTEIVIPDSVTVIEDSAFSGCSGLTEIVIPDSVTTIGDASFKDCSRVTKIMVPAGITYNKNHRYTFSGCHSIKDVTIIGKGEMADVDQYYYYSPWSVGSNAGNTVKVKIEEGVSSIGCSAFSGCSGLTEVVIPNSVTVIGGSAFSGCSGLTEVVIPNSVTVIGDDAFSGCSGLTEMVIPSSVTEIGNHAFSDCSGLTELVIPDSVIEIGNHAFSDCSGLTEVVIPNSITVISDGAFFGCSGLTEVMIPDSVTEIGENAFSGCSGLMKVVIPDSVTEIDKSAFLDCSRLTGVVIPDSVTVISDSAFFGCSGLTEMVIPNSITVIGESVFANCSGLTEIVIPNSITVISDGAFFGCSGLTEMVIPNSITVIGEGAFSGCSVLTKIVIPDSVINIGNSAFEGCSMLKRVELYPKKAPSVGYETFDSQTEVHALYSAIGYDEGNWPQYKPILDLLKPIDPTEELGHNLNLSGSIGVNFFFHLSDEVLADEGAKVHFDLPNGLTSEVMVKDAKVQIVKDVECREFGCKLHSSQMTGLIKAKVILSDGTESEEFPYTVKEYADLIIENPDNNALFTKVTPLIKAMLNYGGYAQAYFKYDDNPLANKDLTAEERNAIQAVTAEDVKDYERVVMGTQEGLKYEGSNLMLTSETCIRHFFTVQSGHDISEYSFKMDGNTLTPVKSGTMYYVEIPNIASGNLDTTYTVTVGGITIQYSALSYVYTQLGKTDLDADLANTLKALYLYNQEANLYFKK